MKKDQYNDLAKLYDLEAEDPDTIALYREWRDALERAVKKYRTKVRTIIDLACGTGNTTIPWANKKYRVIGVDGSGAMLRIAGKKSKKVKWIRQDLTHLDLKEKADAITCHFDALDHILSKKDLQKVFKKVFAHLADGGIFLFDMNTENWFRWLHEREKLFVVGKHYFVASNRYDPKTRIVEFRQLWFVENGDRYKKIDVRVNERSYKRRKIERMLKKAGLRLLSVEIQRKIEGKPARLLYLAQRK